MTVQPPMQPLLKPAPPAVRQTIRVAGVVLAAYVAGVHLGLAEQRYETSSVFGSWYVLGSLILIISASVAASGRWFSESVIWAAWFTSVAVAAAMGILFVLSRVIGLPGYTLHDWPIVQILALAAEAGYVLVFLAAVRDRQRGQ